MNTLLEFLGFVTGLVIELPRAAYKLGRIVVGLVWDWIAGLAGLALLGLAYGLFFVARALAARQLDAFLRPLAERQMGAFLKTMPKAKPAGSNQHEDRCRPETAPPTLAEIGITKKQSATAQKLADIPEPLPDLAAQRTRDLSAN